MTLMTCQSIIIYRMSFRKDTEKEEQRDDKWRVLLNKLSEKVKLGVE